MTIIIDDAGIGDLLFGVVIGAFREETTYFTYDIVDVKFFRTPKFRRKEYLKQATKIIFLLLNKLKFDSNELIKICRSYLFDDAVKELEKKYGEERVQRFKVVGEPQELTETAYLDELRNLGYEPIKQREEKRAKSFFHMLNWLKKNPERLTLAKNGWPKLVRYHPFKDNIVNK